MGNSIGNQAYFPSYYQPSPLLQPGIFDASRVQTGSFQTLPLNAPSTGGDVFVSQATAKIDAVEELQPATSSSGLGSALSVVGKSVWNFGVGLADPFISIAKNLPMSAVAIGGVLTAMKFLPFLSVPVAPVVAALGSVGITVAAGSVLASALTPLGLIGTAVAATQLVGFGAKFIKGAVTGDGKTFSDSFKDLGMAISNVFSGELYSKAFKGIQALMGAKNAVTASTQAVKATTQATQATGATTQASQAASAA